MRKCLILLVLCMIPLIIAKTETVTLEPMESFEIKDKNITLIKLDSEDDKVVLCISNEKVIVSDTLDKSVNGVTVHIKSVKSDYAKIEFTRTCTKDCSCEENKEECSNIECFHECDVDLDCNDNNPSTNDFCRSSPRTCINIAIPLEPECSSDSDCNDNNECTTDNCISKKCTYNPIINCKATPSDKKTAPEKQEDKYLVVFFIILFIIIIIASSFKLFKRKS